MNRTTKWLVGALLLAPLLGQQPATGRPDVGRRLADLQKEQDKIAQDFRAAQKAAAAAAEQAKADGKPMPAFSMRPDFSALRAKYLAAAKEYEGDDQVKLLVPALGLGSNQKQMREVFDLLLKDHIQSKQLGELGPMLDYLTSTGGPSTGDPAYGAKALARIESDATDPTLLGWAAYARCKAQIAKGPNDPGFADAKAKLLAAVDKANDPQLTATAKADLAEVETFGLGMQAPDLAGTDLDGVDFKLSDYRGKVVFLDFWGDW
jgi:hypothetical protein